MDSKDLRMLSEAYSNIYNNDDFRREDSRADALDYEEKNDALKPSAKIRSTKGVVKISVVKKAETGEYVAKVYINGKYQEGPSYYTDSLEDAIATKKHMLNHYADSGYIIKESLVSEASKKVNPWAVEKALEKKTGKHFSKEKKEKIIKGIKKGAKKYGKKITSKNVKKK